MSLWINIGLVLGRKYNLLLFIFLIIYSENIIYQYFTKTERKTTYSCRHS